MRNQIDRLFEHGAFIGCLALLLILPLCLGLAFGMLCLEGWILMLLWNAILVPLFNFGTLTFWWGVGIVLICNILFKSSKKIIKKDE